MKYMQLKIVNFLRKNVEIFLLIILLIISIFITQLYNLNTKKIQKDYLDIIRNTYFKKSINHFFSNLKPKFENIEYKVKSGDTLFKILSKLSVDKVDIQKISALLSKNKAFKFNQNQTIKLTLENKKEFKKVLSIIMPISLSRKLEIYKELDSEVYRERNSH